MPVKVGVNGFGRIGRLALRAIVERSRETIEVVALNDLTDVATNAHLFRWDTVYGPYHGEVAHDDDSIQVAGYDVKVFEQTEPKAIDWASVGAEIVIESTGRFTDATVALIRRLLAFEVTFSGQAAYTRIMRVNTILAALGPAVPERHFGASPRWPLRLRI